MLKPLLYTILPVIIIASSLPAVAAPDGSALYDEHCSVCHGVKGEGGVGVPLGLPDFINNVPDEYLFKTIRHGRPGRIMPPFKVLSDAQVHAIVNFIRGWGNGKVVSENNAVIAGDAEHGKQLYAKHCSQCHGETAEGGKGTGVTFSRKRDLPIIAPALNNSGFLAAATDTMLRDTIMNGRDGTPMSSQLVVGLSGDDIDDLVSYIRSFEKQSRQKSIEDDSYVITVNSPYSMDETIENLKQAIANNNFTLIRIEPLDTGFVPAGEENRKQMVLHFCNFGFLFDALSIDPRVGMFLPCRITVVEDAGKVKIMVINPLRLSKLFNNDELDSACREMHDIYQALLEDATL